MIRTTIRQQGDQFVAVIAEEEMARFHLHVGDTIAFIPQVVTEEATSLPEDLSKLADEVFAEYESAFRYLADRSRAGESDEN